MFLMMLRRTDQNLYINIRIRKHTFTCLHMCREQMRVCVCSECYTNSVSVGKHRRQQLLSAEFVKLQHKTRKGAPNSAELKALKQNIRRATVGSNSAELKSTKQQWPRKSCRHELPGPSTVHAPLSEESRSSMRKPETKYWRVALVTRIASTKESRLPECTCEPSSHLPTCHEYKSGPWSVRASARSWLLLGEVNTDGDGDVRGGDCANNDTSCISGCFPRRRTQAHEDFCVSANAQQSTSGRMVHN